MNTRQLEEIYRILENLSATERDFKKAKGREPGKHWAQATFLWGGVLPFALALLFAAGHQLFHDPFTTIVGLSLLLVSGVVALVAPVIDMFVHRKILTQSFRDPWVLAHGNVSATSSMDSQTVMSLQSMGVEELEFAKLQETAEREALERRISLVVGPLDKVGILAGILGFCVIILKIGEATQSATQATSLPWWMLALAYAAIGLQLLAIGAYMAIIRMDRHIKLLDFAINHRPGTAEALSRRVLGEVRSEVSVNSAPVVVQ